MNLREDTADKSCMIRVPGHCAVSPCCLCHVRIIGVSGMGMKSPDLLAAVGCQPCHDIVDGRTPSRFSYTERRALLLEGMARTQAQWIEREVVSW